MQHLIEGFCNALVIQDLICMNFVVLQEHFSPLEIANVRFGMFLCISRLSNNRFMQYKFK